MILDLGFVSQQYNQTQTIFFGLTANQMKCNVNMLKLAILGTSGKI